MKPTTATAGRATRWESNLVDNLIGASSFHYLDARDGQAQLLAHFAQEEPTQGIRLPVGPRPFVSSFLEDPYSPIAVVPLEALSFIIARRYDLMFLPTGVMNVMTAKRKRQGRNQNVRIHNRH